MPDGKVCLSCYNSWARRIGEFRDVFSVERPLRLGRLAHFATTRLLISIAFANASFGASRGLEMANALAEETGTCWCDEGGVWCATTTTTAPSLIDAILHQCGEARGLGDKVWGHACSI